MILAYKDCERFGGLGLQGALVAALITIAWARIQKKKKRREGARHLKSGRHLIYVQCERYHHIGVINIEQAYSGSWHSILSTEIISSSIFTAKRSTNSIRCCKGCHDFFFFFLLTWKLKIRKRRKNHRSPATRQFFSASHVHIHLKLNMYRRLQSKGCNNIQRGTM